MRTTEKPDLEIQNDQAIKHDAAERGQVILIYAADAPFTPPRPILLVMWAMDTAGATRERRRVDERAGHFCRLARSLLRGEF